MEKAENDNKQEVMNEERNRIVELDFFKGIAILLVVLGHSISRSVADHYSDPVLLWIYSFHMPLFFFISGYLISYTSYKKRSLGNSFLKKGLTLLIPYLIWTYGVSFIEVGTIPKIEFVFLSTNSHYWFVYLLFLFSLFYLFGSVFKGKVTRALGGAIIAIMVFCLGYYIFPCNLFGRGLQFLPFYYLGSLACALKVTDYVKFFKEPVASFSLLLFMVSSLLFYKLDINYLNLLCKFISSLSISYIVLFTLFLNRLSSASGHLMIKSLTYFGRNSIVIYMTHFFFLKITTDRFLLIEGQLTPYWEFTLFLIVSLIIIAGCLLIGKIIENFGWLDRMLYGRGWRI